MEIHPLIDPFAIHYDSFAGDVYTLDTASITLTGGDITADVAYLETGFIHTGDVDTQFLFLDDGYYFAAGGVEFLRFQESKADTMVFNSDNADIDITFKSVNANALIKIDAGLDTVSFGDGGSTNYSRFSATGNLTLNGSAILDWSNVPCKPKIEDAATEPNIGTATCEFWWDSTNSKMYLLVDRGDTQYKVELT